MQPDSARARFWEWFRDNGDRLRDLMYGGDQDAREAASAELREAVEPVQPGLVLEFGPSPEGGPRQLVVSADGRPERVNAVKEFVASAPALPGWAVVAFRPRMPIGDSIEIALGGETVGAGDIWFQVTEDDDGLNLTLHVRGLTPANERLRGLGASLLAEHAVGEGDAMTLLSSLRVAALPADPAAAGLRPFRDLVGVFDEEKARRYPPPGALRLDAEGSWQGLSGKIDGAPALVLLNTALRRFVGHPAYDRRLTVAIPFNQADPDGMPASQKEFAAVQDIGTRLGEALEEGQQCLLALTLMTQGRRQLILYTSDAEAALRRLDKARAEVETHRVEADVEWDTFWGTYRSFCDAAAHREEEE
jgi:uncharacterized protein DUF695